MYEDNEYLSRNDIHYGEAASSHAVWKFEKIRPSLDQSLAEIDRSNIAVLDVGGGDWTRSETFC